ncbi:RNA methyltransferase [Oceanobacillus sp. Castelsardo]|uniref:TrmH family RNA methyltransferase n=1 Tax=Oceanobacillus sp. Castelsardo TaxID=1851204 RepID=UPI000837CD47|nr:RNA methyltransferase [Oceanobacillus sp. Castelsardo]
MITSVKNEKVKAWKKLQKRKERTNTQTFLVEGYHLLQEAKNSNWHIKEIIAQEGVELPSWGGDFEITKVSNNVFEYISETRSPQGIAAIIEMKKMEKVVGEHILLIDSIQDPGNLGTIIRTADAAGFDGVILGDGTVDLYNDKVIRATQGSVFHIPIFQKDLQEVIPELKADGFSVWATALEGATLYNGVSIDTKVAIVLGNEGAGVDKEIINEADKIVKIPIYGQAESLNVSIAAGILMYYVKG